MQEEKYRHLRLHMEHMQVNPPIPVSEFITVTHPPKTKLGFDHIYVINLERRPERRLTTQFILDEWGIDAEFFNAVDGRLLSKNDVRRLDLRKCRDYRHVSGRDLTYGEVISLGSTWYENNAFISKT